MFAQYNTDRNGEPFKWRVSFADGTTEIVYGNNPNHAMMLARKKRSALRPDLWHEAINAERVK